MQKLLLQRGCAVGTGPTDLLLCTDSQNKQVFEFKCVLAGKKERKETHKRMHSRVTAT
jgi:hypothetical protein